MSRTLLLILLAACSQPPKEARTPAAPAMEAPPPLAGVSNAYEAAGQKKLAEIAPEEYPDLHNVYRLSDRIISGSEPHGEEALKRIAEMGVKTIVSVDGKVPDAETAARYGVSYVHVPIHYSGISPDEMLRLAKTFREQEGPFYVHCFHGKHRGPAGAAVGRLVLDGTSREDALAEMRQWCGTSPKYEGLYRVIASGDVPAAAETAAYDWDFPAAHPTEGFRAAMVDVTRYSDNLKHLDEREWQPDPDHPDVDAVNEAEKMLGLFERSLALDEVKRRPEDFREWLGTSVEESRSLVEHLRAEDAGRASKSMRVLLQTCNSCHASYRNE